MEINIRITDGSVLTDTDKAVLRALAGQMPIDFPSQSERIAATVEAPEVIKPAVAKPATGQDLAAKSNAAAAKAAAAKAAAAKAAEAEPEPDAGESTLEDAIAKATEMVSEGRASEIKAALNELGAKKVSELKGSKIADFLAKVNA